MQVTVVNGHVDRIFFHIAEQRLFLKLKDNDELYEWRVSGASPFVRSIMLTKPDDAVVVHIQKGRIDKWGNETMHPDTAPTAA